MPKGRNNKDNEPDEQFIITQSTTEVNKQDMKVNKQASDDKMTKFIE